MSFSKAFQLASVMALSTVYGCAPGGNSSASPGTGAGAQSNAPDSSPSTAASNGASGSGAPGAAASTAGGSPSSNGAQNANIVQNPNAVPSLHAYVNHVFAEYTSSDGILKSANGNALILTDDPNACAHAANSYRVLSGSTTIQIFDPNFLAAAKAIGVQVNVTNPNNTLVYAWAANDLSANDPNQPPLCCDPGFQGVDSGVGTFAIKADGSLSVTLPGALSGRAVDNLVSTCPSAMVAPYHSSVSPGHQPRAPVSCAAP